MAKGHSLLGASSAARWLACPGSFDLVQLVGEEPESEHAALGTAAHKVVEMALNEGKDAWEFVGQKIDGFDVAPDRDDAIDPIALQVYLDYISAITDEADYVEVEHTFGKKYKPNPYFWGTADFVAVSDRLHVVDYKNGAGIEVDAVGSPQLQYYAWGAINELDFDFPDDMPARLAIVQPRSSHGSEPKEWVTTVGAIRKWATEVLLPGMDRAISGAGDLQTGEHCRFCPARLACPAARADFEAVATATADVSDEALDRLYLQMQTAKIVMKAIEARILARCMEGAKFEHIKLVKKRTTRTWKEGVEPKIVEALGDDAYVRSLVSPAQAEKISSKMKAFVAENAFLPESDGYTIALATSPTPEATPSSDLARQFAHYDVN
jgi:hypothetical protein